MAESKFDTELIPVIHMVNEKQVFINLDTCFKYNIKKVFLINHRVTVKALLNCAELVRKAHPKLWLGLNMLGQHPLTSIGQDLDYDGMWVDETITSGISEECREFRGMLFTGLAFKYQPQPKYLKEACQDARFASDVATTSGAGTGQAANLEKIKLIREYLGNHPMAIASGINADNVKDYKGLANYLLVASSFTSHDEYIIPEKLMAILEQL
jgi:hypothetical protein